jgi:hypothetical protein
MSSTIKIILGLVAVVLVVCLCAAASGFFLYRSTGRALGNILNTDAAKVVEVAKPIADYTLPAGFGNAFSTEMGGFSMVAYTGDDGHSHIYFIQLPANLQIDQAKIESQIRQASPNGKDWATKMEIVERKPAKIDGQDVTLMVSEGINHDNQPYREASAMFQGKGGGQAMVMISGPIATWDQAVVDEFLASIR